jgi:RloB-like protein
MARTRGKDTLGPAQKAGRRRRIVHVFTEGRVTEPEYIRIIRERAGVKGTEVRIANASAPGSQRKPVKLVEAAVQLMRDETRAAKRSKLEKQYWPAVWCLFDRDQHEHVDAAIKDAEAAGVRVAFSHPCFEVWRLLHHKPVTGTFGRCDMVVDLLPFAKNSPNIKAMLPEQLPRESFQQAKKRALQMNAAHGDHVPMSLRDPYTNVFDFVEDGMGISAY